MHKRIIIIIIYLFVFDNYMVSQNNYTEDPKLYYNFRDTVNNVFMGSMTAPTLTIVDSTLENTLIQFIDGLQSLKESRQIDTNGIFISILICYDAPDRDTDNIHILLLGLCNYYMYSEEGDVFYRHVNAFRPENYYSYPLGYFYYNNYLVCVTSKRYIPSIEINRFFLPNEDYLTLRIFEEQPHRRVETLHYNKSLEIPLLDKSNYVSPIFPR